MKIAPWAAAASAALLLLAGCGLAANPQPPTLWLPQPVKDLTAARVGNQVQLHWTMPKNTTDKVALRGKQRAHFCWEPEKPAPAHKPAAPFDPKTCQPAGDADFAPGQAVAFTASLPAWAVAGPPRLLGYYVELQNHAGKTAGLSNAAWVPTGAAPPAVMDFRAEARADGVVLHWNPAAPEPHLVLRIHRTLIAPPHPPKPNEANGAPPPEQQTLEVDLDRSDPGGALDADATLDHIWRYTAERVQPVTLDGHALEIAGAPSAPVTIDAKNVFPPPVPTGLAAVVDTQAHSIDLSWEPDTAPDIAGYAVYRRDLTAGTPAERISGPAPIVAPSFDDSTAQPGHRYAYSVSAIDRDGNESAQSTPVEEELPQ